MGKKLLAIILSIIIITSSFTAITLFVLNEKDEKPTGYTKPYFETAGNVNETGMLIDIDYEEIESKLKTYSNKTDKDGDELDDDYEKILGLDPYISDTDGDGLNDKDEITYKTNPLDPDTDIDGLYDGEEVHNHSTNPTKHDTDQDGLYDGEEVWTGTNPNDSDSDDDGVPDGKETNWNEDTDADGNINALDTDSDNDELKDNKELYSYNTNMILKDTDNDGINDYYEAEIYDTDPLKQDTDLDGLKDGIEAYESYFFEAESHQATNANYETDNSRGIVTPDPDTGEIIYFHDSIRAGNYKLMALAKISRYDNSKDEKPKLSISLSGREDCVSKTETLQLPVFLDSGNSVATEYRWVSTSKFEVPSRCIVTLEISMIDYVIDESISIDKFAFLNMDNLSKSFTNPLYYDSDYDGIIDGNEAAEDAYWFEAEDFVFDEDHILGDCNASNGKTVSTTHLPLVDPTTLITININSNISKGYYSLFIKGYSLMWSQLDVEITYVNENGGTTKVSGTYEIDGTHPRGLWVATYFNDDEENLKIEIPNPTTVTIKISTTETSKAHPLTIDKIAFVKMTYKKPTSGFASQLPGLVPRLLTDPMDPDTDGDQYRKEIGAQNGEDCQVCASMLSICGYLTDEFELDNGMNPMSMDSDSDFIADDIDPNPLGQDADDDGIPDFFEDTYPEDMPDGIYQEDNENTDWCNPDTDRDRVIDGNEDWDFDTIVDDGETNPANPDTDGDGLLDGGKDLAPVLLEGKGQGYTTTAGSAQYAYLASVLNKVNNSGVLVDPWITSGDSVTFIGEVDKGTDPNDIDSDDDLIEDGVEVFIYGTNPIKVDTDEDTYTDYDEIFVMGTDPLVPDYPDLSVNSITMTPETVELDWWNETMQGTFTAEVENTGKVDAYGKIQIQLTSNGQTVYETIRDLGVGQTKQVEFGFEAVAEKYYDIYYDCYVYTIILKPGRFTAEAKVETQNPDQWYGEKVTETSYANNILSQNITIKGAAPEAFLETNLCHNWIMAGENITFYYHGFDTDGTIVKYEIDFEGDGVYDFTDTNEGWLNHTYEQTSYNGIERAAFTAELKVTDDDDKTGVKYVTDIAVSPALTDDTDGDGLTNEEEIYTYGTNMDNADFDRDTLNDYQELLIYNTDPYKHDTDSDGIRDDREILIAGFFGLNATDDADGDGLPNILDADSDNDGIKDGTEYTFARPDTYDPVEIQILDYNNWDGTNPYRSDTDFDGISDYAEEEETAIWGVLSKPHLYLSGKNGDTDNDALSDYEEVYVYASESHKRDTDGDGLEDGIDLQPLTEVVTMGILDDDFPHGFKTTIVENEHGVRWTRYYPKHMLRFETDVRLCGLDGTSWDIWGEDECLGNEGVLDSDISSDTLSEIGYGDYEVYDHTEKYEGSTIIMPYATATTDGLQHYKIVYALEGREYFINLWNTVIAKDPNNMYYTAQEIGLEKNYNNSIELQFKIIESRDKYDISNEENLYIPAFLYKLFEKGTSGMSLETGKLVYYQPPVFDGIAQATEIKDKKHWYHTEIKLSKDNISQENMIIVISPIWIKSEGQEYLNPKNLKFASLSKIVYYNDGKLRVGCRTFDDLHKSISMPSSWDGEVYKNYTSIKKISDSEYQVIEVKSIKKVKKDSERWDVRAPHTIYEQVLSSKSSKFDNVDDFTGEISTYKYEDIRKTLKEAAPDCVLATDYQIAAIKFPDANLLAKETKWALTAATSKFVEEKLAPEIFGAGVKNLDFKANAACAVVFGAVDISIAAYHYANTDNPILERQYAEEMWSAGVSIGLNLIPYYFIVELATKLIVYLYEWIVGWPEDVNIGTLSDPAALIVFAVEYFIPSTIPSDFAKKALKDACNIMQDNVERINLLRDEGERFYVFIPP